MRILDQRFESPEENLACDEVLLEEIEGASAGGVLRFWESKTYFVVVGYGESIREAVDEAGCEAMGIGIYRRCSGGGAVLQGPGCLNYAVVGSIEDFPEFSTITRTNRFVMERNRRAIERAIGRPVEARGVTDLAIDGRKISGNAQRRRRSGVLFHGTILLGLDLDRIERCLRLPLRRPKYRMDRSHREFMGVLEAGVDELKDAMCSAWEVRGTLGDWPKEKVEVLAKERYALGSWIRRLA